MTYQETLTYLFEQLPMYQRIGKAAYKDDLQNTIQLCKLLGNPERKFKSIHVAGTNGKGSTCHMLASILQEAGYKVGLYTSPHLKDFRERIKINGQMMPKEGVVNFVETYKTCFEAIHLSFFEWTVGLAFHYFETEKVDIAIIETGLGGRLDSTNVIYPELAIITNIGMDHMSFLGDTLSKIAKEKAGIVKKNIPVVIGETQKEIKEIFIEKATTLKAPISFADQEAVIDYETDLKGYYQKKNVTTSLQAIHRLREQQWVILEENIINGLRNVVKNTGLIGRWQVLGSDPIIICDVGHNESGVKEIITQINSIAHQQAHIVFGMVNDKSIDKVLQLLPKNAVYYFCEANIPRSLDVNELYQLASTYQLEGIAYKSVKDAVKEAKKSAKRDDLIFIGGSTFVVAEAL